MAYPAKIVKSALYISGSCSLKINSGSPKAVLKLSNVKVLDISFTELTEKSLALTPTKRDLNTLSFCLKFTPIFNR